MTHPAQYRIETLPAKVAVELELPGAIVIGVMDTGDIIVNFHGIASHRDAVEKLAVAIHAVLSSHDREVLAGAAGQEAQERFKEYSEG